MNSSPDRKDSSSDYEERVTQSPRESEPGREKIFSTQLFHGMCLAVLLIVASAASFSAFYEKWHFREQGARGTDLIAEFDRMIDGSANRPYIYRQLLPDLANSLTRVLPVDAITRRVPARAKERIGVAFNLSSKKYPAQYLIVYIATYLSALFAAFALYRVCAGVNL